MSDWIEVAFAFTSFIHITLTYVLNIWMFHYFSEVFPAAWLIILACLIGNLFNHAHNTKLLNINEDKVYNWFPFRRKTTEWILLLWGWKIMLLDGQAKHNLHNSTNKIMKPCKIAVYLVRLWLISINSIWFLYFETTGALVVLILYIYAYAVMSFLDIVYAQVLMFGIAMILQIPLLLWWLMVACCAATWKWTKLCFPQRNNAGAQEQPQAAPQAIVGIDLQQPIPPQAPARPAIPLPAQEQGAIHNQNLENEPINAMAILRNMLNRQGGKFFLRFSFVFNSLQNYQHKNLLLFKIHKVSLPLLYFS